MLRVKRKIALIMAVVIWMLPMIPVKAEVAVSSPSVILIESSTGQIIYELNSAERRSPASITKIMTLLLTFEALASGKVSLTDQVLTSEHASSMGGSQVYLAAGEVQTLETMIKCIVVASGNDASVAVAEHIAGSEQAFVDMMNEKAVELGMVDTHFEDCCGLSDSDGHYSCARDVAIMSRELTTKYPDIFNYTTIWMEDITHETRQGVTNFTLSSTNKLLKQYQWATGLKTGSTSKARFCLSATASKDGIDLIAVIMGAPDKDIRSQDAQALLTYGFSVCNLYIDENKDVLPPLAIDGGVQEEAAVRYQGEFRYLDVKGSDLSRVEKVFDFPETIPAPVEEGAEAGKVKYLLDGAELGSVPVLFAESVEKAGFGDYFKKVMGYFLL
ncbi:MAG: D-alanyl-D-alanine carboxypeptidase [Lachnospiraceae bacterium]|nr:D-alanyl-D-alanine carboxypeptidase [Lachnospiraceae bacterium]MCI9674246.1 D-alanyl-D-alanine carboxypeptidase [Lachnospiraceae bacterium]